MLREGFRDVKPQTLVIGCHMRVADPESVFPDAGDVLIMVGLLHLVFLRRIVPVDHAKGAVACLL